MINYNLLKRRLPCQSTRGQQVLHQMWIWGFNCMQVTKHTSEGIYPGFETEGRSPKQRYQWPHKKEWSASSKNVFKKWFLSQFFEMDLKRKRSQIFSSHIHCIIWLSQQSMNIVRFCIFAMFTYLLCPVYWCTFGPNFIILHTNQDRQQYQQHQEYLLNNLCTLM